MGRAQANQGVLLGQHEQRLEGIQTLVGSLANDMQALRMEVQQLTQAIRASPGAGPSPSAFSTGAGLFSGADRASPVREVSLSTPHSYSGDPEGCRSFLMQCENIFCNQPLMFAADASRVAYVINLLTGRALQWADALRESRSDVTRSFDRFSGALRQVFEHPSRNQDTASRLHGLRQGSRSVADYSIDFRIIATESGWNDVALLSAFVQGLSEALKDALPPHDQPATLDEMVNLAIQVDNRLRERRRTRMERVDYTSRQSSPQRYSRASRDYTPRQPSPQHHPGSAFAGAREKEGATSWRASPRQDYTPPSTSGEPMQLGKYQLSAKEHQRRIREGLCLYCGREGHLAADCSLRVKGGAHQ